MTDIIKSVPTGIKSVALFRDGAGQGEIERSSAFLARILSKGLVNEATAKAASITVTPKA